MMDWPLDINLIEKALKPFNKWNLNLSSDLDYIQSNFRNIERLYNPEFNRDWNIDITTLNGAVTEMGSSGYPLMHLILLILT